MYATTTEPAGYTYKAEQLCPNCTIENLKAANLAELYDDSTEDTIRTIVNANGADYDDLHSYDSDDLPKPVMPWQIECGYDGITPDYDPEYHERCDSCRSKLCGED